MDNRNSIINSAHALMCSSPFTASLSSSFLLLLLLRPPLFRLCSPGTWCHPPTVSTAPSWLPLFPSSATDVMLRRRILVVPSAKGAPQNSPFLYSVCFSSLLFTVASRPRHFPAFPAPPTHCLFTVTTRQPPCWSHHQPILPLAWFIYLCGKVNT